MGEYAKYKNQEIKIGTCECMYYLRYEDRFNVSSLYGNINPARDLNLFWRLPFPDEDQQEPGGYNEYNRGVLLYKTDENGNVQYFNDESIINHPGIIQLAHKCGYLINAPCYHGYKLPENSNDIKIFWNGKSNFIELAFIKNTEQGIKAVLRCRHCGHMWSYTPDEWGEILPYIPDEKLRERLSIYEQIKQTV